MIAIKWNMKNNVPYVCENGKIISRRGDELYIVEKGCWVKLNEGSRLLNNVANTKLLRMELNINLLSPFDKVYATHTQLMEEYSVTSLK